MELVDERMTRDTEDMLIRAPDGRPGLRCAETTHGAAGQVVAAGANRIPRSGEMIAASLLAIIRDSGQKSRRARTPHV